MRKMRRAFDGPASNDRTKRLRRFLDTEKFSDVSLLVGPNKEAIRVVRAFLASASDALEAMFSSSMIEGQPGAEIAITDLQPCGMRALINFAYSGDTDVSTDALVPTFAAARKYEVRALREACLAAINSAPVDAALAVLEAAARSGEDELTEACARCPALGPNSIKKALSTPAFHCLSEESLRQLLQFDACKALCAESLWEACQSWARSVGAKDWQQRVRSMGPLLPTQGLSCKYLSSLVEKGLLETQQIVQALQQLGDAIPLSGAWKHEYEGTTTTWYTVQGEQEHGSLSWVLKIKMEDIEMHLSELYEGTLTPVEGWYVADLGSGDAIRLRSNVNKLQLQLKTHNDDEWSNSIIAERWL